ncbi:MAG: hypothetical protein ACW99U_12975 [Candidatus Thorarchaeota archaeon]|jgi:hypothetical protein
MRMTKFQEGMLCLIALMVGAMLIFYAITEKRREAQHNALENEKAETFIMYGKVLDKMASRIIDIDKKVQKIVDLAEGEPPIHDLRLEGGSNADFNSSFYLDEKERPIYDQ